MECVTNPSDCEHVRASAWEMVAEGNIDIYLDSFHDGGLINIELLWDRANHRSSPNLYDREARAQWI
jgi:hypothetical protein